MRFIEDQGRMRILELSPADIAALKDGARLGGESIVVSMVEPMMLRKWVMRSEHCRECDRPEICAVIKAGSGPCGRNRHVSLEEQR